MAVIRVSGHPGSGKTTLCKRLAEQLGYEYFYAGKIFRDLAARRNLTIEEFYSYLALDPSQEQSVDDYQTQLMKTRDNLVVEGRMAPFLPCNFKKINLLLTVDPDEGARRQQLRPENAKVSLGEIKERTVARIADEHTHYQALYSIADHFDPQCYDLVIDTTKKDADAILTIVLTWLTEHQAKS